MTENPSQKHSSFRRDSSQDLLHSSDSDDADIMFDKQECAQMFREEVRDWIREYGPGYLKAESALPIPKITQVKMPKTPVKKQSSTSFKSSK